MSVSHHNCGGSPRCLYTRHCCCTSAVADLWVCREICMSGTSFAPSSGSTLHKPCKPLRHWSALSTQWCNAVAAGHTLVDLIRRLPTRYSCSNCSQPTRPQVSSSLCFTADWCKCLWTHAHGCKIRICKYSYFHTTVDMHTQTVIKSTNLNMCTRICKYM